MKYPRHSKERPNRKRYRERRGTPSLRPRSTHPPVGPFRCGRREGIHAPSSVYCFSYLFRNHGYFIFVVLGVLCSCEGRQNRLVKIRFICHPEGGEAARKDLVLHRLKRRNRFFRRGRLRFPSAAPRPGDNRQMI
jgi:hypothetical protein